MMIMGHPLRAMIFDLDGTLVSSSLDFPLIRRELGCPEGVDLLAYIDGLPQTQQEWAHELVLRHEMNDAIKAQVLPGVESLLFKLNRLDIRTGIVTRNSSDATRLKLSGTGIVVDRVLTREDAPAKPDPQALLQLCREWEIRPGQAMYVGDFRYDVEAANNAGVQACLYAPETEPDYAHLADLVIEHFDELITLVSASQQATV